MAVGIKDKNSESGWIKLFDFGRIHLMRGQDVQLLQVLEENNSHGFYSSTGLE